MFRLLNAIDEIKRSHLIINNYAGYVIGVMITGRKTYSLLATRSCCSLKTFFSGLLFPDKGSESGKGRESNHMNLNTRDIVVVQIGFCFFIIFDFTSEGRGRKSTFENCSFLGAFFRHYTSLVNILLNNIEQKLFNFNHSFI